jgi:hypothetical protein
MSVRWMPFCIGAQDPKLQNTHCGLSFKVDFAVSRLSSKTSDATWAGRVSGQKVTSRHSRMSCPSSSSSLVSRWLSGKKGLKDGTRARNHWTILQTSGQVELC